MGEGQGGEQKYRNQWRYAGDCRGSVGAQATENVGGGTKSGRRAHAQVLGSSAQTGREEGDTRYPIVRLVRCVPAAGASGVMGARVRRRCGSRRGALRPARHIGP